MSFLYPLFLVGAAAIALPILLHLLRRDVAPEVPFTAVRLLQRSPVERVRKRRLRDLLLLAARVAALLLLAAAFARPYVQGVAPPRVRVVAIDRSYSMGGPGRFERARDLARAAIDEAEATERVALIAFDDRADVLAVPGGKAEARAALGRSSVSAGATRYSAVVDKALEIAGGAGGRLVVVTDLQPSGWSREAMTTMPRGWEVEVKDVGSMAANLAVTALAVEPGRVVATVRHAGSAARSGRVRALLDGRPVAEAEFALKPGEIGTVPIAWRAPGSGALTVSVDDPEGLPADNSRFVALGARDLPKALVVTGGGASGLFLARALETSRDEEGAVSVDVVPGAKLAAMAAEEVSSYPMVALLSTRGLERRSRETLAAHVRAGNGLLVAAASDLELAVLATMTDWRPPLSADEQSDPLTLAATDPRHPIFRPFGALAANLGQVRFERSWRVNPEGWSIAARFSNGTPALLERPLGQGRVVVFASDLDRRWNDFPLHPAFVPFVMETVRHVMFGSGDRRRTRDYTIGEAPPGAGPGAGVFRAADGRIVAVNVDPTEGGLERMSAEAFAAKVQRTESGVAEVAEIQARQTEARQSYWQYGLLLMLFVLVAESVAGRS